VFFFEKNSPLGSACGTATPRKHDKSLFASFSSEKEDFFFAFDCRRKG
jgi:hypothetical protein